MDMECIRITKVLKSQIKGEQKNVKLDQHEANDASENAWQKGTN